MYKDLQQLNMYVQVGGHTHTFSKSEISNELGLEVYAALFELSIHFSANLPGEIVFCNNILLHYNHILAFQKQPALLIHRRVSVFC